MEKEITFAVWNIEKATGKRLNRCLAYLDLYKPDIFALFECSGKDAFYPALKFFPNHNFQAVDNQILIGVHCQYWHFQTTKKEFKSEKQTLRPGVLSTIQLFGKTYISFLFLHFKAFSSPLDFGLRDDAYQHLSRLKKSMPEGHRTVFAGDFNTVGTKATYNDVSDLTGAEEIQVLDRRMKASGMIRHSSLTPTWWNGNPKTKAAPIDHIYGSEECGPIEVTYGGWPAAKDKPKFIAEQSDHALLTGKITIK